MPRWMSRRVRGCFAVKPTVPTKTHRHARRYEGCEVGSRSHQHQNSKCQFGLPVQQRLAARSAGAFALCEVLGDEGCLSARERS